MPIRATAARTRRGALARRTGVLLFGVLACLASGVPAASAADRGGGFQCQMQDHIVTITLSAGGVAVVSRTAGGTIRLNGDTCPIFGEPATVWNTKQIRINGADGSENVTLRLANGGFAPGYGDEAGDADEIEFVILMGGGWDQLRIDGTSGPDHIAFGSKPGAWLPAPAINLNDDGDLDVVYQSADYAVAWGYGGGDAITGSDAAAGTAFLPIQIIGGQGDDELTGGDAADTLWGDHGADTIKGGKGADTLYGKDGTAGNDTVNGGAGTDSCTADPGDVQGGCE